jgi:O-antigen ligase
MFPVTFLTVRHGVHISLFALLLITAYQFWHAGVKNIQLDYPRDFFILFIFSGLLFSVLISQIFRGAIHSAAFDGPSRILFAGAVFLMLKNLNIPYIRILGVAIPSALICIFTVIILNPLDPHWMERYSMYFVDPNTLGSQTLILGLLSLLMISWNEKKSTILIALQVLGGLLGLYVSIGSGSRGGWLTAPFILLIILLLRLSDISHASQSQKQKMWLQTIAVCASIFFLFLMGFYFSEKLSTRIISGYFEILHWFSGANLDTSAGTRLVCGSLAFSLQTRVCYLATAKRKI